MWCSKNGLIFSNIHVDLATICTDAMAFVQTTFVYENPNTAEQMDSIHVDGVCLWLFTFLVFDMDMMTHGCHNIFIVILHTSSDDAKRHQDKIEKAKSQR
jgi:hypothetical protein